ncbi:MAG: hypothetical protein ACXVHJ_15035 [Solirubrobacteraceae bacterium]
MRGHGGRDRYGLLHGGSSFDLERINPHAANGNGRGGGTAVFKFYELRDNLVTGDEDLKHEGERQEDKGKLKGNLDEAVDKAQDVIEDLKDKATGNS